jgi:hypothetical protein
MAQARIYGRPFRRKLHELGDLGGMSKPIGEVLGREEVGRADELLQSGPLIRQAGERRPV